MRPPLRVGILGAGRMAQGFDHPEAGKVLTLAHAVSKNPDLVLSGFFDIDMERVRHAEEKWKCPPSPRNRSDWLDQDWDIVIVATPDAQHGPDCADVLLRHPKAIMVEKPLATDLKMGQDILSMAENMAIPILVNFPRRWHSRIQELQEAIARGVYGQVVHVDVVHSGTIMHSGIHAFDLLHTLFGGGWLVKSRYCDSTSVLFDLKRDDFVTRLHVRTFPESTHYVWEVNLYFEGGKIEFGRSPEVVETSVLKPHLDYPEFSVLGPTGVASMESEPLLTRATAMLVQLCRSNADAVAHARREAESLQLAISLMECIGR